jgi:hypothetical protein
MKRNFEGKCGFGLESYKFEIFASNWTPPLSPELNCYSFLRLLFIKFGNNTGKST